MYRPPGAPAPGALAIRRGPLAHGLVSRPAERRAPLLPGRVAGAPTVRHGLARVPARRADAGLQFRARTDHRKQALPARVGSRVYAAANLDGTAAGDARPARG